MSQDLKEKFKDLKTEFLEERDNLKNDITESINSNFADQQSRIDRDASKLRKLDFLRRNQIIKSTKEAVLKPLFESQEFQAAKNVGGTYDSEKGETQIAALENGVKKIQEYRETQISTIPSILEDKFRENGLPLKSEPSDSSDLPEAPKPR